ncbi:ANKRD6 [Symbiodinium sp. CCMP2592]|nr:ANKRD6 [Symbiodinium sp. CCMP2592]
MRVARLFLLASLPLAEGGRAARQDALQAAEGDLRTGKEEEADGWPWSSPSPSPPPRPPPAPKPPAGAGCEAYRMNDATKRNLNRALSDWAHAYSNPADIELQEATEKHDMMKFCALLHHSGELNDVPVQNHLRDRDKKHLPKKPNMASRSSLDCSPCIGRTPLLVAAEKGYVEMVKELLAARAPDLADNYGRTLLILAASKGQSKVIKPLLDHGANVDAQDYDGMTVLHYCYQIGIRTAELVLKKNPDLALKNRKGETAEKWNEEGDGRRDCYGPIHRQRKRR